MFFPMKSFEQDNQVYQHRVGAPTVKLNTAAAIARKHKGFVVNENNEVVLQAFNESLPRHVDKITNISSGEDCWA